MAFEVDTSKDLGGEGTGLKENGNYHMFVTAMFEDTSIKGKPLKGGGFSALLTVLAGSTEGQEEKTFGLTLFNVDFTQKESAQEWARRKQTAALIAMNVLPLDKLGSGKVAVDLAAGQGHQLIINLKNEEYEGETNLRLQYANVYHVDDPRVADLAKFPRNVDALKRIEAPYRKPVEYFAAIATPVAPATGSGKISTDAMSKL